MSTYFFIKIYFCMNSTIYQALLTGLPPETASVGLPPEMGLLAAPVVVSALFIPNVFFTASAAPCAMHLTCTPVYNHLMQDIIFEKYLTEL